jgi:toxin HigB-1
MIVSFGDRETEELFHGRSNRKLPPDIVKTALRKLDVINAARSLIDLHSPPGNRLEQLAGALGGLYSIRINGQWRIVFRWTGTDAQEVRIVDYH